MTDLDKAFEAKLAEKQGATTTTPSTVSVTKVDEETGEVIEVGQLVPVELNQSFLDFTEEELTEAKPAFNISTVALELTKPGEKGRYMFAGISHIDYGDGNQKPTASLVGFQNGIRTMFTNSGVQLVKELQKVPVGGKVEITLVREQAVQSAPGAKAKIYSITILS
jgi:hypothetical protein